MVRLTFAFTITVLTSLFSESDVALFDLAKVCDPGHTLLWDLVVEEGNQSPSAPAEVQNNEQQPQHSQQQHTTDRLPPELQVYALQMLEEVVAWAPSIFIKKVFVRGCVEKLRHHK